MFPDFLEGYEQLVALGIVVLTLAGFVSERYQPAVVAAGGAAAFMALGLVSVDQAMEVFSNPAPITIAAMFVLTGALVRTGVLEAVGGFVMKRAARNPVPAIVAMLLATTFASAVMNNTPVVLVLIPIFVRLSKTTGIAPTRFLIPLSYAAIVGGTCTLIGTSTNLLVDGVAQENGMEPFSIFEITPIGIVGALAGYATMTVLGRYLLPHRRAAGDFTQDHEATYLADVMVRSIKAYEGRPLGKITEFNREGITVMAVKRGTETMRSGLDEIDLQKGDILVVRARDSELLTLSEDENLRVGGRVGTTTAENLVSVEAIVAPGRRAVGETIANLALAQRFGVRVLGVHRHRHIAGRDLESVRLRPADRLLLQGPEESLSALTSEADLISLTPPKARAFRRARAPVAILGLAGVVLFSALHVMPIGGLALIAVAAILLLKCIDGDEAWQSIDGDVLVLIFSMLIVGTGLQESGAIEYLLGLLGPVITGFPPLITLFALYLMTSILTETVTNNAVAVIVTPLAIGIANQIGADPRPFVVAVMFAASASFATPIGYQTNTLVYGAANYRFSDFLKIGIPMNMIVGFASCTAIALYMGV